MSDKSAIEWTDATWNPVTGCTKVSPGCAHCYAETFAERWRGTPGHHFEHGFDLKMRPERLDLPLSWKKPKHIFVNSMSDLFHEDIPEEFIQACFTTMAKASWHTFQILTKRPARMWDILSKWNWDGLTLRSGYGSVLPNVWLGVSVENQKTNDERVPLLLGTPAAVRWISYEPLLERVVVNSEAMQLKVKAIFDRGGKILELPKPDWVVVGGESGPGARPFNPDWAREIKQLMDRASIPFFMKQMGGHPSKRGELGDFPEDLRVRDFPNKIVRV